MNERSRLLAIDDEERWRRDYITLFGATVAADVISGAEMIERLKPEGLILDGLNGGWKTLLALALNVGISQILIISSDSDIEVKLKKVSDGRVAFLKKNEFNPRTVKQHFKL